jgi:hypothetical protein
MNPETSHIFQQAQTLASTHDLNFSLRLQPNYLEWKAEFIDPTGFMSWDGCSADPIDAILIAMGKHAAYEHLDELDYLEYNE